VRVRREFPILTDHVYRRWSERFNGFSLPREYATAKPIGTRYGAAKLCSRSGIVFVVVNGNTIITAYPHKFRFRGVPRV
jgi:hypothetical protein